MKHRVLPEAPSTALPPTKPSARPADHVLVGRRSVRVDTFEPTGTGGTGTVLLYHGVGGLLGDGALMRRTARTLAGHGFHVGIVHYFNATGTLFATQSGAREHAVAWKAAFVETARHYARTLNLPVGLMGYSLGGTLAVSAAHEVPEIEAVAVIAGGLLNEEESPTPEHLPSLLVLHGAKDTKIPVERADALLRMEREAGALVEGVFYPKEGHSFGASVEKDAIERAAEFFAARLGAGAGH